MAVICLVALTAMAQAPRTPEARATILTAGLTITRALAVKVDVTKVLAAKVKERGRVRQGLEIQCIQQPTIANGRLYIRGFDTVVCYQLTEALFESTPMWDPR